MANLTASSRSIADLVAGGIPAVHAIATATSLAADACGLGDRKGRLQSGYGTDMVVVDGDPVTDIRALDAVQAVYLNGEDVTNSGAA